MNPNVICSLVTYVGCVILSMSLQLVRDLYADKIFQVTIAHRSILSNVICFLILIPVELFDLPCSLLYFESTPVFRKLSLAITFIQIAHLVLSVLISESNSSQVSLHNVTHTLHKVLHYIFTQSAETLLPVWTNWSREQWKVDVSCERDTFLICSI
jgi:hypothetical protein